MRPLVPAALFLGLLASIASAAPPPAQAWQIGPIIRGKNYSVGIGGTLRPGPQGPWFAFPEQGRGHVHYVTLPTGSLDGARQITVRYRIDAPRGTRFVAQESGGQGTFGLAFQRAGDTWSAKGRYEAYRWYSPSIDNLAPGIHTFIVRFDDPNWISVYGKPVSANPHGYASARMAAESVSMTFGGTGGRGHGVYSTAPARFTLLDFRIE